MNQLLETYEYIRTLLPYIQDQQAKKNVHQTINLHDRLEMLLAPDRVIECSLPVQMDNGSIKLFTWYRAQHNNVAWPYKGWIRFHPQVTRDEVALLSLWMTLKCAVLWLPLGWWKWGVCVAPQELTPKELEGLTNAYIDKFYPYIGPEIDIPAPDVNTNEQTMAWMRQRYEMRVWHSAPGVVTWKPLNEWWSLWRKQATWLGGLWTLITYLENTKQSLSKKRLLIQWMGNVGGVFAQLAYDAWATIIGISDATWWIYHEHGVNITDILQHKQKNQSTQEMAHALWYTRVHTSEFLTLQTDILVPAALEMQITDDNVHKLQCTMILELANWPTSPSADRYLAQNTIPVIPDILANAWWVCVSYYEQIQNANNTQRTLEDVNTQLIKTMRDATVRTITISNTHNVPLRTAATLSAIDRLIDKEREK
jgi:glutamate dehydrogenase/leucine dehydrogenase